MAVFEPHGPIFDLAVLGRLPLDRTGPARKDDVILIFLPFVPGVDQGNTRQSTPLSIDLVDRAATHNMIGFCKSTSHRMN